MNRSIIIVFGIVLTFIFQSCYKNEFYHYDSKLVELQARIDAGETPSDLIDSGVPIQDLYGLQYGGGFIFYIDQSDNIGYIAYIDNSYFFNWGCYSTSIPTTEYNEIGRGQGNTIEIVSNCNEMTSAAYYCHNLDVNGYSDWFLPSRNELREVMNNIPQFVPSVNENGYEAYYWSSSQYQYDDEEAYLDGPQSYSGGSAPKEAELYVIAVRKFNLGSDIQDRLDQGETPLDIYQSGIALSEIYGKFYEGGIIFYIDSINGGGMVMTDLDQIEEHPFGCYASLNPATSYAFGMGQANTNYIINNCSVSYTIGATYCDDLNYNSYQDWYLPSFLELEVLYNNVQENLGLLPSSVFMSSTQNSNTATVCFDMVDGTSEITVSYLGVKVLPVRNF